MKVLGITHPYSYNNAACLIIDGKLIAFAEEERFIRYKHAPHIAASQATQFCLDKAGIKKDDLDYIAVGLDDWYKTILPNLIGQSPKFAISKIRRNIRWLRLLRWQQPFDFKDPRVVNVNHHMAHIASSFYLSGFEKSNIISWDGAGESEAGMIGYGEQNKINVLHRITNQGSWGALYEEVTKKLGFRKHSQEGKTMGLASFGRPDPELFDFIDWQARPIPKINWHKRNEFLSKIKGRPRGEEFTQDHKDLAATLQYCLEKAGFMIVDYLYSQTGNKNLCLAGGVALNCAMNGKFLESPQVDNIFIQPASSDAGTALGAAALVYTQKKGCRPDFVFDHAYWGPEFSNQEIEETLKECKVSKYHKSDNIFKETAQKLSENKIVGWFQGRMEIGPRALGCRSILANPSLAKMKDEVNNNVKKRESWRPFAPSVLEEHAKHYVENYHKSPFMILAFKIKPEKKDQLIAATHVDDTVRLQSVSKKTNLPYWNLINEFRKISGVPGLLNTSYNLAGEPVVCTPRDAVRTFYGSGLDCLAIGDYLIEK